MSPSSKPWEKFCSYSFLAFIATLPFQTNLFITATDWGRGFLNPYLSITFILPELFLILSSLAFLISRQKTKWSVGDPFYLKLLSAALGILTLSIFIGQNQATALFLIIKITEFFLLYILVVNKVVEKSLIFKVFIGAMSVEALIAIFQGLTQTSLGLHLLGEPSISANTAHLAKLEWGSFTWIRAYGTFPHSNILGGFLVLSLLALLLQNPFKKTHFLWKLSLALHIVALIFSASRSALLALTCALLILGFSHIKKIKNQGAFKALALFFSIEWFAFWLSRGTLPWKDLALLNRLEGYQESLTLFLQHPFGLGWKNYTLFLDEVVKTTLAPWDYQPVHNAFLLGISETGLPGLLFLLIASILLIKKIYRWKKTFATPELQFKKNILLLMAFSILLISLFDHYWFSLQQGSFLALLVLSLISEESAGGSSKAIKKEAALQ